MKRTERATGRDGPTLRRRELLGLAGGALVAGVAGCADLQSQTFSASEVVLPAAAQTELSLAESSRERHTISGTDPTGNLDITIENYSAVYSRAVGLGGE